MNLSRFHNLSLKKLHRAFYTFIVLWTILIFALLFWAIKEESNDFNNLIKTQSEIEYQLTDAFRNWVSDHGGVYIQSSLDSSKHSPQSRIITDTHGNQYKHVSFFSIINEINQRLGNEKNSIIRIISNETINPENQPDKWEKNVLKRLIEGDKEVYSYNSINNRLFFRLYRPILLKNKCLNCHQYKNYEKGMVVGALGININVDSASQSHLRLKNNLIYSMLLIWLVGLFLSIFARIKWAGYLKIINEENQYHIKNEYRTRSLLKLSRMADKLDENEIYEKSVDLAIKLTDSEIGYICIHDNDKETFNLISWNKQANNNPIRNKIHHSHLSDVGVWADCAIKGKPIIHNTYQNMFAKEDLPVQCKQLERQICLPVLNNEQLDLILGVGNKKTDYTKQDAIQLQVAAEAINKLLLKQRAEKALRDKELQFRNMVDLAGDAILIVNPVNAQIEDHNETACFHFGYNSKELKSLKYTELDSDIDDTEESWNMFISHIQNRKETKEIKDLYKKDGSLWPVEISISQSNENNTMLVIIIRDISSRMDFINRLKKYATKDALTGLYNRRTFEEQAAQMIQAAKRYQRASSLLMIDIDHFKSINDSYGHHAGDIVLKAVSSCILSTLRDSDLAARFGGEEFLVLLNESGSEQAIIMAERLRLAIEAHQVKVKEEIISVTVSIGVSEINYKADRMEKYIEQADSALYKAKNNGRNQIKLFSNP